MPNPARKPARTVPAKRRPAKKVAVAVAPPPQLIAPLPKPRSSFGRTVAIMAAMVLAALVVVLAYVRFGHPGSRSVQVALQPPTITAVPVAPTPVPQPLRAAKPAKAKPHATHAQRFPMAFSLQQSADEPAELAVFPQHGKALRVVKAESPAAGKVVLRWDGLDSLGNSLPAGSYYLRLTGLKTETVQPISLP